MTNQKTRLRHLRSEDRRKADRAAEKTRTGLVRAIFPKRPEFGFVKIRRGSNQNGPWRKVKHLAT